MKVRSHALTLTTAVLAAGLGLGVLSSQASATTAHGPATTTPSCTTTVNWIGLPGDGFAGGQVVELEFSNLAKVTCTLYGHPGVAQGNLGQQVGLPATWVGTPATITLKPGATAHARLTVTDAGAICTNPQPTTYLSVIAPGLTTSWPDPYQSSACPGKSVMQVSPVETGVGVPFYTSR